MTYEFGTEPYRHQRTYLERAVGRAAFAVLCDYGTGKSKMIIDEAGQLFESGRVDTLLVVTYKGNYITWPAEVARHLPRRIHRDVHIWDGSESRRARDSIRACLSSQGLAVLVMNIEAVVASRRAQTLLWQFLGRSKRRMTVVDESPCIKNWESLSCKQMVAVSRVSEYRRICTGNLFPHSPLDAWGQFLFLGAGRGDLLGCASFYAFRARYCHLKTQYTGDGRTVQVPYAFKNLEELEQLIAACSYRVRKEDCLDLPPKMYSLRWLEMTPEQHRVYADLKARAWAQLEAQATVSAAQVMAQRMKLHQVLCGMVIDDDGVVRRIPNNRLAAMEEVIEECGHQTIVWCAFRANAQAVTEHLRRRWGDGRVVEYHGGVAQPDRIDAVRRFQSGDAHYIVATPQAGGRGGTWTAARQEIYYSNTENLDHRLNSEDRAHRIGQRFSVTITDLVIPDTMDMQIVENLRAKIDISTQLMGDDWREWVI